MAQAQVWWAGREAIQPWQESLLTPADQERRQRLLHQEDRDRLVVGNALMRLVVAHAAGIAVDRVQIDRGCPDCERQHGKPQVVGLDLHVSVSHSGNRIAVALTDAGPTGIDVEQLDPRVNVDELHFVVLSPDEDADEMPFHTRWTRKEAILKATGDGLRRPMSSLTLTKAGLVGFDRPCSLHDLSPGEGYAASLAVLTASALTVSEKDASGVLRG